MFCNGLLLVFIFTFSVYSSNSVFFYENLLCARSLRCLKKTNVLVMSTISIMITFNIFSRNIEAFGRGKLNNNSTRYEFYDFANMPPIP